MDAVNDTTAAAGHTPGILRCEETYRQWEGNWYGLWGNLDAKEYTQIAKLHPWPNEDTAKANGERLAAAWNAADGLTTAQLEQLGPGGVKRALAALAAYGEVYGRCAGGLRALADMDAHAALDNAYSEAREVLALLGR